jgi:hypothetical protein
MARNYMIELGPVKCIHCGKSVYALIRSREELETFSCLDCLTSSNILKITEVTDEN